MPTFPTFKAPSRLAILAAFALSAMSCGKSASDLAGAAAGKMTFTGTVSRAGTTTAIPNANVVLIPLASVEAIQKLVEVKKIPNGKGGQADRLRIKLDKLQTYIKDADVTRTTTDASGKFKVEAPVQVYLAYVFGPDGGPGSAPQAFGADYWGVNPVTGELDKDHLIGVDLKLTQNNDKIQLSGGPVVPPPPAANVPQPPPVVVQPTPPATPPAVQPEPKAGDTTVGRGDLIPPVATSYWASVKLNYDGGFAGTGGSLSASAAPLPSGQSYLELEAELTTAQTDPVYLVIQKGFDSNQVADCGRVVSAATTRVYPVAVNGTRISYSLVPPGPYYKLFFAKSVVKGAKDGDAPASTNSPSDTLTVGTRTCGNAAPTRPFLATLTWDKEVDLDLYVYKYDAAKVALAKSDDDVGAALVDQSNYMSRQGTTLSLDVDNIYAYGPESNGDNKDEKSPENFCYLVKVQYYAGSEAAVHSTVDVTYVVTENGNKTVKQLVTSADLKEVKEWATIGVFGQSKCSKLVTPPSAAAAPPPSAFPTLASCVNPASCSLKGNAPGSYKAALTLTKATFATSEAVQFSWSGMPDLDGNWVTIVPKAYPDNSWCSWSWASGATGTQAYSALPAGDYEVRMYYNWTPGQCEVIGRQAFTVTP